MSTPPPDATIGVDSRRRHPTRRTRPVVLVAAAAVAAMVIGTVAFTLVQPTQGPRAALIGVRLRGFGSELPSVNGEGHVVAPWTNGRAGVLLFFAHWCAPCRAELPTLAHAIGPGVVDGAQVIGVDEDASVGAARAFVRQSGVRFPVGQDYLTQLAELLVPAGLPAAVFVEANGRVAEVHYGTLSPAALRAGIVGTAGPRRA